MKKAAAMDARISAVFALLLIAACIVMPVAVT